MKKIATPFKSLVGKTGEFTVYSGRFSTRRGRTYPCVVTAMLTGGLLKINYAKGRKKITGAFIHHSAFQEDEHHHSKS